MRLFLVSIAVVFATLPAASQTPVSGKALFETYCISCHGQTGEGDDSHVPDIRGANSTKLNRALGGLGKMPKFEFSDDEISKLQAYLTKLDN